MPSPIELYSAYLKANGMECSAQAVHIVNTALAVFGTFSAEDIIAKVDRRISRPSICRTIERMVEAGLLQRVSFNQKLVYVAASSS